MKIQVLKVCGLFTALEAMRNPMNSWDKADTEWVSSVITDVGQADSLLSRKLTNAGTEHCKHLRFVTAYFELALPRYIWQEFDTYKFCEKISCSTMHKLFTETEITVDDFVLSGNTEVDEQLWQTVKLLNKLRVQYLDTKDYSLVIAAKKILPESFIQQRTVVTNYAELLNIYKQRRHHRLPEWRELCKHIEQLPHFTSLTGIQPVATELE